MIKILFIFGFMIFLLNLGFTISPTIITASNGGGYLSIINSNNYNIDTTNDNTCDNNSSSFIAFLIVYCLAEKIENFI